MRNFITIVIFFIVSYVFSQESSVFWKVQKDSTISYILGTNHIFGKSYIEKDKIIFNSLKSSSIVLLENIESKDSIVNSRDLFGYTEQLSFEEKKLLDKIVDKNINIDKLTLRELLLTTQNYWEKQSCLSGRYKKDKIVMEDFIINFATKEKKIVIGLENISETLNFIETEYLKNAEEEKILKSLRYRLNSILKNREVEDCTVNHLYANKKIYFILILILKKIF